jgi:hypothetical protein
LECERLRLKIHVTPRYALFSHMCIGCKNIINNSPNSKTAKGEELENTKSCVTQIKMEYIPLLFFLIKLFLLGKEKVWTVNT